MRGPAGGGKHHILVANVQANYFLDLETFGPHNLVWPWVVINRSMRYESYIHILYILVSMRGWETPHSRKTVLQANYDLPHN